MKKISLLFFSLFATLSLLNAQLGLTISYDGNDVTNSTVTLVRDAGMFIHVTNNSGADINAVLEITELTTPHKAPSWEVCWGDCVLPTGPMIFTTPLLIPNGTTNIEDYHVLYLSDGNTDPANITMQLYEQGNSAEFISLTLDTEYVGMNDLNKNTVFTIFPNPAQSNFTISLDSQLTGGEIIISNILGKTYKKVPINGVNMHFNAKDFTSGIYFISVVKDQTIILTKKLIINE